MICPNCKGEMIAKPSESTGITVNIKSILLCPCGTVWYTFYSQDATQESKTVVCINNDYSGMKG